jgi:hypothetical protein
MPPKKPTIAVMTTSKDSPRRLMTMTRSKKKTKRRKLMIRIMPQLRVSRHCMIVKKTRQKTLKLNGRKPLN